MVGLEMAWRDLRGELPPKDAEIVGYAAEELEVNGGQEAGDFE